MGQPMVCRSSNETFNAAEEICNDVNCEFINDCNTPRTFHSKYVLGGMLGRGAFAEVRLARSKRKHEERAVKIIDVTNEFADKLAGTEAKIYEFVGCHANCMRLYEAFFDDSLCYLVMENCKNSFLSYLEGMPELTERSLGQVFGQMLAGLGHVHSVNVVHRDIKPDNFLVGGSDGHTVKLTDFGLSAVLPEDGKVHGVFGTAPFMCPEMLTFQRCDCKADVWSLGVIVYVLLFGAFPYEARDAKCMKRAIIMGIRPKWQTTGGSQTQCSECAAVFAKALLTREPEQRPTASDALRMLDLNEAQVPADLPCLRPMLQGAKSSGAFEARIAHKNSTEHKSKVMELNRSFSRGQAHQCGFDARVTASSGTGGGSNHRAGNNVVSL